MQEKKPMPSGMADAMRAFGLLSGVGIYFVVFLGIFLFLGQCADDFLGTGRVCTITGILLGFPAAIYSPTLLLISILTTTLLAGQSLDIATRIHNKEPLPDAVLPPYCLAIALGLLIVSLLHSIVRLILTANAIPATPVDIAMAAVFVFLIPLANLVYLYEQNAKAIFSPHRLLQALHAIGELRYFAVTATGLALLLFLPQRFPVTYTNINDLYTLLAIPAIYVFISSFCRLLAVTYPVWYYPPVDDAAGD
mgnify:CR=1 FL=1